MPAHPLQEYATQAQIVIKNDQNLFNKFYIALASSNITGSQNLKQSSLDITYQNGGFVISSKSFFGKNFKSTPISYEDFTKTIKYIGINLKTPPDPAAQKQKQAPQQPVMAGQAKGQASQGVQHQKPPPAANVNKLEKQNAANLKRLKQLSEQNVNANSPPQPVPHSGVQYSTLPGNGNIPTQQANGQAPVQQNQNTAVAKISPLSSGLGGFSAAGLKASAAAGQASPKAPTTGQAPSQATSTQQATVQASPTYDVVPPITDPRKREMPIPPVSTGQTSPPQASPPRAGGQSGQPAIPSALKGQPVNYGQLLPDAAMNRPLPQPNHSPTTGQASGASPSQQQSANESRKPGVFSAFSATPKPAPGPGANPARVMGNLNDVKAPSQSTPKSK